MSLTNATSVQRPHVENVNALHLAHNLQTLETGGLLEIGGDGTRLRAADEEVLFTRDVCAGELVRAVLCALRAREGRRRRQRRRPAPKSISRRLLG